MGDRAYLCQQKFYNTDPKEGSYQISSLIINIEILDRDGESFWRGQNFGSKKTL